MKIELFLSTTSILVEFLKFSFKFPSLKGIIINTSVHDGYGD